MPSEEASSTFSIILVEMSDEKTILSAYLPVELAENVARLAAAGNRSVSREVAQAIREHVASSLGGSSAPLVDAGGEGRGSGVAPAAGRREA